MLQVPPLAVHVCALKLRKEILRELRIDGLVHLLHLRWIDDPGAAGDAVATASSARAGAGGRCCSISHRGTARWMHAVAAPAPAVSNLPAAAGRRLVGQAEDPGGTTDDPAKPDALFQAVAATETEEQRLPQQLGQQKA